MDTNALFVLYYATFAVCILFYVFSARRCKLKLASASNIAFAFAFIVIALPGFYVAAGTADDLIEHNFHRGFDTQLFWIYFLFMPIVSTALILGQVVGQKIFIKTIPREKLDLKIKLIIILSIVYCLAYLLWLPHIPLNSLLFSSSLNFYEIYMQRIVITHGLGQSESLPFVFRYWRNIAHYILPFLLYFYFITKEVNKRSTLLVLFFFLYTMYLQLFTIEKAPFFVFLLGLMFVLYLEKQRTPISRKKINLRSKLKYITAMIMISASIVFVYKYFMNVQDGILWSLLSRFASQSTSNYIQIEYIRQIGFLGFSGIKMPLLSSLLNIEFIDPSKYAIAVINPSYVEGDIMGAAGGMSLTNLYYIMGWFSIPTFFGFVFLFGYIDRIIINTIYNPVNRNGFYLNISFYAMFSFHFAIAVGSYVWLIFAIPTILSPSLIIIMAVYFIFIKIPDGIFKKVSISSAKHNCRATSDLIGIQMKKG